VPIHTTREYENTGEHEIIVRESKKTKQKRQSYTVVLSLNFGIFWCSRVLVNFGVFSCSRILHRYDLVSVFTPMLYTFKPVVLSMFRFVG